MKLRKGGCPYRKPTVELCLVCCAEGYTPCINDKGELFIAFEDADENGCIKEC